MTYQNFFVTYKLNLSHFVTLNFSKIAMIRDRRCLKRKGGWLRPHRSGSRRRSLNQARSARTLGRRQPCFLRSPMQLNLYSRTRWQSLYSSKRTGVAKLSCCVSAINHDRLTCNVASSIRTQEHNGCSYFFRLTHPPHWDN
jgi:hypothetical protein